jgi:hypothetical protein
VIWFTLEAVLQQPVLVWDDPVDHQMLLRPPSAQATIYDEQRRQAKWAFRLPKDTRKLRRLTRLNGGLLLFSAPRPAALALYVAFAVLGIAQVVVGLALAIFDRPHGTSVAVGLFASGGVFGTLFNWGSKLSQSTGRQLDRITSHEHALELVRAMSDPAKRDQALLTLVKSVQADRGPQLVH